MYDEYKELSEQERIVKFSFYSPPTAGYADEIYKYFGFEDDDDEYAKGRYEAYNEIKENFEKTISDSLMNLNLKIFEKIKEFIFQSDESSRFLELPKQEIPTVILSTGLNLVDHKLILTLLCDYLKNHEHLHLVRLISSENPSLTAIVRNVLLQVLACEHEKEFQYDLKASKREINYLSSWYKKRYFEAKNVIPIVILFEDLQTFSVQAVCEFLTQCSIMQPDVKFVFVFNVPLLQNVVQKYPGHILSLLATEKFGLHPPHVYLDDIIEKVCINPAYRFFLHSSSFAYLLDRFTSYELCFSTFTESYKYMLTDFIMNAKLGFFCSKEIGSTFLTTLPHRYCEQLRSLFSFRLYFERELKNEPKLQLLLLDNDYVLKLLIRKLLADIDTYHYKKFIAFKFFAELINMLKVSACEFGNSISDIYLYSLQHSIISSKTYNELLLSWRKTVESEELLNYLNICSTHIKSYPFIPPTWTDTENISEEFSQWLRPNVEDVKSFMLSLKAACKVLENMIYEGKEDECPENFFNVEKKLIVSELGDGPRVVEGEKSVEHVDHRKILTRSHVSNSTITAFQNLNTESWSLAKKKRIARLLTNTEEAKHSNLAGTLRYRTNYEIFKEEIISIFHSFFEKAFKKPSELPLSELFYCTDISSLKKETGGSYISRLQNALANPEEYNMRLDSKKVTESLYEFARSSPYICVVYKIYLNCGKLINLYDLFTSFCELIEPNLDVTINTERRNELHVYFMEAVTELHYMGFIKNTNRKTDHVERILFT